MSAGNFPSGALWNGDTLEHALRSAVILTVFALLFGTSIVVSKIGNRTMDIFGLINIFHKIGRLFFF
jgi:hypothetical protein